MPFTTWENTKQHNHWIKNKEWIQEKMKWGKALKHNLKKVEVKGRKRKANVWRHFKTGQLGETAFCLAHKGSHPISLLWLLLFAKDLVFLLVIIVGFSPLSPREQLSHLLQSHELLCCGCVWLIIPLAFIKSVDWHPGREAAGPEGEAIESQQDLCPTVCVFFGHVRLCPQK